MRQRLITVILFAVIAAGLSSTVIYKLIAHNSPGTAKAATAPVFVAVHDLNAGALVGETDVRPVDLPVVEGSPWIARRSDLVGRALLTPVAKGEPFSSSRLAVKGSGAGLASTIPPGMRVVAVRVSELSGLSRFIFAGMHVDVISTVAAGGQNSQPAGTRTILQNIEVFSAGQDVERDAREKPAAVPVFNLLVTPQQAEVLSQAIAQTRIELVLRNPLDKGSILTDAIPGAHLPDLSFVKEPRKSTRSRKAVVKQPAEVKVARVELPPPPPVPAAPPTVEVIHGTKRTVSPVAAVSELEPKK